MKTTLSEREGNTVKLAVEVSSEELQEAFESRLKKLQKEARLPGFRPGKAPLAMLRQRVGDQAILLEAIDDSLGTWFTRGALELNLDVVDTPQIDMGDDLPELGKDFSFSATATVMPEVELGQYKGVEVVKENDAVTAEEIDSQMDRLRNEFAELKPVEGRAAEKGDFVTADFSAEVEGMGVDGLQATDFVFEVGASRIFEEVEQAVPGMNAGDTKTVAVPLPEGYPDDIANKTADFTITVKEIKEKILPALTDEWAAEISEFATMDELRAEIQGKMQAGKTYQADQKFRAQAVQAVADKASLDMPDIVVKEQAEEMLNDFARSLQAQGADMNAYMAATGTTAEQMLEDMKPTAANNVKTGLVLDAVAQAEGLEASDEDIKGAVMQMAMAGRVDPKQFEERLRKSGRYQTVVWQVLRDKAADFIAANAVALTEGAAAVAEAKAALAKAETAKDADKAADKPAKPKTTRAKAKAEAAPAEAEAAPEAAAETEAPEA